MSAKSSYLATKSWNPLNAKNVERVVRRERETEEEKRRILELQKQHEEERELERLEELQEASGLKKRDTTTKSRLNWMYQGPSGAHEVLNGVSNEGKEEPENADAGSNEDYLLGKKVKELDKEENDHVKKLEEKKLVGSLWLREKISDANEQFHVRREDPMFAIQEEQEHRLALKIRAGAADSVLNNNLKKKKKKKKNKEKKTKKDKKAKRRNKRRSDSDDSSYSQSETGESAKRPKLAKKPGYGLQLTGKQNEKSNTEEPSGFGPTPAMRKLRRGYLESKDKTKSEHSGHRQLVRQQLSANEKQRRLMEMHEQGERSEIQRKRNFEEHKKQKEAENATEGEKPSQGEVGLRQFNKDVSLASSLNDRLRQKRRRHFSDED